MADDGVTDDAPQRAPFVWKETVADAFPPAFRAFLRDNDVHPDNYAIRDVPRYIRVSPRVALSRQELERQLHAPCEPVTWLPGYYALSSDVKIAGCDAYRSGGLYGIDLASGAAVAALGVCPGDHVLDMCCAPGAKLCALADALGLSGSVTGVDISAERLGACRTLCCKYGIANARLLVADATTFADPPPAVHQCAPPTPEVARVMTSSPDTISASAAPPGSPARVMAMTEPPLAPHNGVAAAATEIGAGVPGAGRSSGNPSASTAGAFDAGACDLADVAADGGGEERSRESSRSGASLRGSGGKRRRADAGSGPVFLGDRLRREAQAGVAYDRVLVDAECTHDGSVKHLAKFSVWGWDTFERRFLDPDRLAELRQLQYRLLRSGFGLLREGGYLVYSTCSFAVAQNEEVVAQLLADEPAALLAPIEGLDGAPCVAGGLEHTVRFDPRTSRTSALFIAKIHKRRPA
eukprot:scaffold16523_cov117-Isochrysis_galbana.AAC.1